MNDATKSPAQPAPSDDRSSAEGMTKYLPSVVFYNITPEPGCERAPVRSFRVVNELAQLESHFEGRGLTVDRVVAELAEGFADHGVGCSETAFDQTIYEGKLVAAVVRNFGDGKGSFRAMMIGEKWVWMVEDDGIGKKAADCDFGQTKGKGRKKTAGS